MNADGQDNSQMSVSVDGIIQLDLAIPLRNDRIEHSVVVTLVKLKVTALAQDF